MRLELNKLFRLFAVFFKIGAFTFGGGYAMISLIQREVVEKKHWVDNDEILDIIAIAESTPGPIAINASTFVGYKVSGFFGALFATVAMVIPSFSIITIISFFLEQFKHIELISHAFFGIRTGILVLIINALFSLYKSSEKNAFSYAVMLFSFTASALLKINVILTLVVCASLGIVFRFFYKGSDKR